MSERRSTPAPKNSSIRILAVSRGWIRFTVERTFIKARRVRGHFLRKVRNFLMPFFTPCLAAFIRSLALVLTDTALAETFFAAGLALRFAFVTAVVIAGLPFEAAYQPFAF